MKKQTSLEQQIEELSGKIEKLEDAIWSLHDMLALEEEVVFITDFIVDDKGYH